MHHEQRQRDFHPSSTKIAIIGAGRVGSAYAYALVLRGLVGEIALIDLDVQRAQGEAMDLAHAAPLAHPVRVCAGTYQACRDADIVMVAAGVSQKKGETRLDLLKRNAAVFADIIPKVVSNNPDAILLVATNPVDIMSHVAWTVSGLPADRVVGSGTVLDTARFRHLLSQEIAVDPRNIHAYIIGEHGDSEVAVWSRVSIAGIPLDEFCLRTDCRIDSDSQTRIENEARIAAYEIIKKKGATYYAVAAALLRITEAIVLDQRSILPVSTLVPEEYGLGKIYLSLPSIVGRHGVIRTLELPLNRSEDEAIHRSAGVLTEMLAGLRIAHMTDPETRAKEE